MKINYFENVKSRTPLETTLEALVQSLRSSDSLRANTEAYRKALAEDKDKATEIKKTFPGFLPAARVSERRKRENVTALTGLVMCDFDHVPLERLPEIRQKVNADKHTVVSYVTLSGEGLRVLAAYEPEESNEQDKAFSINTAEKHYRHMFDHINQHYAQLIGCEFDKACKDLSRLSFAAFDVDVFYRPDATPFTRAESGPTSTEIRKQEKAEKRQRNKAVHQIELTFKRRIKRQIEAEGVRFIPGSHNNFVMRVGYLMNKYGFELEYVKEWAQKEFAEYDEAAEVITRCYARTEEHGQWADRLQAGNQGGDGGNIPKASRADVVRFLQEYVDVRYNLIKGLTEMRWKKPEYEGIASPHSKDRHAFTHDTDAMVRSILCLMEERMNLDSTKEKVYDVIENDLVNEFDPLMEYLQGLPKWNPDTDPDYLQELADTVHIIDTDPGAADFWARCLKKWFVWMIVSWTRPDEVNQCILHFVGAQGTYKSTWMRSLMPPELNEYFKVKQNSGELRTDDIIAMSRYGLILHEESDAMNARENNTLKAMITALHSDERAAYGRAPKRRRNIASLCATGNNELFLNNDQGTRRSLVFRVEIPVSPMEKPFNYEGIYSQAYYLMQHGFRYYIDKVEQAELERHNKQFEVIDREENAIEMYVRKPTVNEPGEWIRPGQLAILLSQRSGHQKFDAKNIGIVLTRLGFTSTYRSGAKGYKVVIMDYDEEKRHRKDLAMQPETMEPTSPAEPEVTDPNDTPPDIQDAFSRLLGEKDDE
jgi:hypothetical protein